MIQHILNQDASLVQTTQDKHGDQKQSSTEAISIRFRYITDVDKNVNREGMTSEAIIWCAPDTAIAEGSILLVEGVYWRVVRLVKARRMSGNEVQFLKAFVDRHVL